jgi:hypothetical protein
VGVKCLGIVWTLKAIYEKAKSLPDAMLDHACVQYVAEFVIINESYGICAFAGAVRWLGMVHQCTAEERNTISHSKLLLLVVLGFDDSSKRPKKN